MVGRAKQRAARDARAHRPWPGSPRARVSTEDTYRLLRYIGTLKVLKIPYKSAVLVLRPLTKTLYCILRYRVLGVNGGLGLMVT